MNDCTRCGHVHDTFLCPATGPAALRLIDQTPAAYIEAQVAQITEHDTGYNRQSALHLEMHSLASVIADDVAAGIDAWPATVARYVYARDAYAAAAAAAEARR